MPDHDILFHWLEAGFGVAVCYLLNLGVASLRAMSKSIDQLNEKMAVIVTRTNSHEKILDEHSERIRKLET